MTLEAIGEQLQPIPYSALRREQALEKFPDENLQRMFLAASVICGIISLIPVLGFGGSLALRSVAVLAAGAQCIAAWKKEGMSGLIQQIMRVAFVAIGLAGVVTHMQMLIAVAVAGDIAFQLFEVLRALEKKDITKVISHFTIILIDAFVIASLLTGMWQYMVVAASISAAAMAAFATLAGVRAGQRKDIGGVFEVICYTALCALAITGAVRASEITHREATQYHYHYRNGTGHTVTVYDRSGKVIGTVKPGETITVDVDPKDLSVQFIRDDGFKDYDYFVNVDYKTVVDQTPMLAKDFHTIPVGGASIVTGDITLEGVEKIGAKNEVAANVLKDFLKFTTHPVVPADLMHERGEETITFKHRESDEEFTFDYAAICLQMGYFKAKGEYEKHRDLKPGREVILNVSESLFDLLRTFIADGDLTDLDQLSEKELIELYKFAEYRIVHRLIDLCLREIATRLAQTKWVKTSLLKPHQNRNERLCTLLKHYNF